MSTPAVIGKEYDKTATERFNAGPMNFLNTISNTTSSYLGNAAGAVKAGVAYIVKDMLIGPIYRVIGNAIPIRSFIPSVDRVINMATWDYFNR